MTKEDAQPIEVEVLEIDGMTPPHSSSPHREEERGRRVPWTQWQNWSGNIRKLDARWWPLWVFLGIILLGLVLTLGLIFGVIYIIARFFRNLLLGLGSLFAPPARSSQLR